MPGIFSPRNDPGHPSEDQESEAIAESLRRTIELNPSFRPAYQRLLTLYRRGYKNLEEALARAQKAVDLEPDAAWNYVRLGQIRLMRRETEEARKLGEQAQRLAKSRVEEMFARVFLERVEESEAIRAWNDRIGRASEAEAAPPPRPAESAVDTASNENLEPREDVEVSRANVQENTFVGEPEHREVSGILSNLQCLPGGSLNFIVSVGEQKFVLQARSLESVLVLKKGKIVSKKFRCGPQHHQVIARFVVSVDEKRDSEVKGTLNSLELLR